MNRQIKLPEKVKYLIRTITDAGYEAYAVGGCVRDSILGREPKDWDITTSALPGQIKELFARTIDTGIQHGTVTVMLDTEGFEITTYRIDGEYEDGRHPKDVLYTSDLREDLRRRDFTINAMAYNEECGLIDIFGGLEDIQRKVLRCVGNARERFMEDALRILRAIRFSAELGYEIEDQTREAIRELAPRLEKISAERIQQELLKLLVSPHPDNLRIAYEMGVTKIVLPEFDAEMETEQNHPHHIYNVGEHTLHVLTNIRAEKCLRLAALFHDIGKPATLTVEEDGVTHFHGHAIVGEKMARQILRRLKFDNDTISMVCKLVLYHDYANDVEPTMKLVRRSMNKIGEDMILPLLEVKRADILAQSAYKQEEKLHRVLLWQQLYEQIVEEGQCVSLKTMAVSGSDLIALGIGPGKEIGELLQQLLERILEDPEKNTKEYLLEELAKIRKA